MSDNFFPVNTQPQSWPRAANQTTYSPQDSDQWLRKVALYVYGGSGAQGDAIVITPNSASGDVVDPDLRITFKVDKETVDHPNLLFCYIYNLAPSTLAKIIQYKRVSLSAGYQHGRFGQIFNGTVAQYRRGKETPVDTYLEIIAGDGDLGMNFDTATLQWDKGTKESQVVNDVIGQLKGKNQEISPGTIKLQNDHQLLRAKSVHGMCKDIIRDLANNSDSHWWIDDGKVNFISRQSVLPDSTAVELSPSTGLIGMPEVTPNGIVAQCLLNPNLKLGGLVKIKVDALSQVPYTPGSDVKFDQNGNTISPQETGGPAVSTATRNLPLSMSWTSPTGTYKILFLSHIGDNRGNPWYSQLTCVALDANGNVHQGVETAFAHSIALGSGGTGQTGAQ